MTECAVCQLPVDWLQERFAQRHFENDSQPLSLPASRDQGLPSATFRTADLSKGRGGAIADRLGRKRVFQVGLAGFGLGSLACSLAPGPEVLIAARIFQAMGGSMLTPARPSRRNRPASALP